MVEAEVELSIVVPSYQRRESLVRLLRSLAKAPEHDDPVEVFVVVDGSTWTSAADSCGPSLQRLVGAVTVPPETDPAYFGCRSGRGQLG